MTSINHRTLLAGVFTLCLVTAIRVEAHPVTADGNAVEWFTRTPTAANLGMVVRDALGAGELVWRDAPGDVRTDIANPELTSDIVTFQVTGSASHLAFLFRRAPGVVLPNPPIQIQIAVDLDRVDGSGQEFFAEFADTKVGNKARWERLIETLFGSGGTGRVIDANFNEVATVSAVQGTLGDVELLVPWSALGLNGPPSEPLRFTVAVFRAQANDLSVDVGGAMISNALDVVSDYGNPAPAAYPNTWEEVQDGFVDYYIDVWFMANGEVYSPLLIDRFVSDSSGSDSDEWCLVQNVSASTLSLAGFKLVYEEFPDGTEGMLSLPGAVELAPGATFVVARSGTAYLVASGQKPQAEVPPGTLPDVPDLVPFEAWSTGAGSAFQLANAGDELLLLSPSNILLDAVVYGNGLYSGITALTPAAGQGELVVRKTVAADTDNCLVDFANAGKVCWADDDCGNMCKQCLLGVCTNKAAMVACPNGDLCDGDEVCDGNGGCVSGNARQCDDSDVCNGVETCHPILGCVAGISLVCDDARTCSLDSCDPVAGCETDFSACVCDVDDDCVGADLCYGYMVCDWDLGKCVGHLPLDCADSNPCTDDACHPDLGCSYSFNTAACSDQDPCTTGDVCQAGECVSGPVTDCSDQDACTLDYCDSMSGCGHVALADDDGDGVCTVADNCPDMYNPDQLDGDDDQVGDACDTPEEPNPEPVDDVLDQETLEDLGTEDADQDSGTQDLGSVEDGVADQQGVDVSSDSGSGQDQGSTDHTTLPDMPLPEDQANTDAADEADLGGKDNSVSGDGLIQEDAAVAADANSQDATSTGGGGSSGGCAAGNSRPISPLVLLVALLLLGLSAARGRLLRG